jgi:hypothetical protein
VGGVVEEQDSDTHDATPRVKDVSESGPGVVDKIEAPEREDEVSARNEAMRGMEGMNSAKEEEAGSSNTTDDGDEEGDAGSPGSPAGSSSAGSAGAAVWRRGDPELQSPTRVSRPTQLSRVGGEGAPDDAPARDSQTLTVGLEQEAEVLSDTAAFRETDGSGKLEGRAIQSSGGGGWRVEEEGAAEEEGGGGGLAPVGEEAARVEQVQLGQDIPHR